MNKPKLLLEPWFQLCLVIAGISGGLALFNILRTNLHEIQTFGTRTPGFVTPAPLRSEAASPSDVSALPREVATPEIVPPLPAKESHLQESVPKLTTEKEQVKPALTPKTPGQWIVDANGAADSDSKTIQPVLTNAHSGDVVVIRAGTYRETIELGTSQVSLRGDTKGDTKPIIESFGNATVSMNGGKANMENLTIKQSGGGSFKALHLKNRSNLTAKDVEIIGTASDAVFVENSFLKLEQTSVTSSSSGCGLLVRDASVELTGCQLFGNSTAGIALARGTSKAVIAQCTIRDNERGLIGESGSRLDMEDSVIFQSKGSAVQVTGESAVWAISNSRIYKNGVGCGANDQARLDIKDSDIHDNPLGIGTKGATIVAERTKIHSGTMGGDALEGGRIVLTKCELFKHTAMGLRAIGKGSSANLRDTDVSDNKAGVVAVDGGKIELMGGFLFHNEESGAAVSGTDAELQINDTSIHDNKLAGIVVNEGATAQIESATVEANGTGLVITPDGKAADTKFTILDSRVNRNETGIVATNATLKIENCDFSKNKEVAYNFLGGNLKLGGQNNKPSLPKAR